MLRAPPRSERPSSIALADQGSRGILTFRCGSTFDSKLNPGQGSPASAASIFRKKSEGIAPVGAVDDGLKGETSATPASAKRHRRRAGRPQERRESSNRDVNNT